MFQSAAALLSETWSFLLVRWKAVGIGVLIFGMLLAVNQGYFARAMDRQIAAIREQTGLSSEQFEDSLQSLMTAGAPASEVDRIVGSLQQSITAGGSPAEHGFVPTPQNAALYFVLVATPFVFGAAFVALFLLYVSWIYFLLISIQEARGAVDALKRLPGDMWRTSLLLSWSLLRSFAWIPMIIMVVASYAMGEQLFVMVTVIGMLLSCVLLSRYALAPALLLSRQHGILESARLSAAKARGRLPMVFGLLLIGGLTVLSLLWIGSLVVSIVSVMEAKAGMLLWLLSLVLAVAFAAVYQVRVTRAVLLSNR